MYKNVSLTYEEALEKTQQELNFSMIEFDRWVSANPGLALSNNIEYRLKQQNIKLLRLRIRELEEMRDKFVNTQKLTPLMTTNQINSDVPLKFTKSRTGRITTDRNVNKLGKRVGNEVSKNHI
jgi:hypothetical protein